VDGIWRMPQVGVIKCNVNAEEKREPGLAACGGIFRGNMGKYWGSFTSYISISFAIKAELMRAVLTEEVVIAHGLSNKWLECDSTLVLKA